MNNSELIKNALKNIAPSEELIEKVKSFQTAENRSRPRLRKGIIIPAAICFAACLGVTAAAVTGNLDFDVIFGDRIKVADSELAEELVGKVSNVKYSVSDDDYIVSVAGVTGGAESCYAVIEISRKDGTPVTEHFQNPAEFEHNDFTWLEDNVKIKNAAGFTAQMSWGGGFGQSITENGNIIYTMDIDGSAPISGKIIYAEGDTLVWWDKYNEICDETNSYYGKNKGECGFYDKDTNEPVQTDISSVVAIPLKWSISFKYTASDKSLDVLTCKAPEEKAFFRLKSPDEIGDKIYEGGSERYEFECTVKLIEISPTGGRMDIEFPCNENNEFIMGAETGMENEMYLVRTDSSQIPVSFNGWSGKLDNGISEMSLRLAYMKPDDHFKNYMDISNVCALSFNGTEYPLT
ncbi:MAG: hypothetical protein PUI48_00030 [Oscillospiraceae bacterium]|nr:hypothetical protein [Oscillospiraceae bacterium]MDY6208254.1 hypothetical protein [Oscillospiraceae bacterium]